MLLHVRADDRKYLTKAGHTTTLFIFSCSLEHTSKYMYLVNKA